MKGDRLSIAVSSFSTVEDALFNSAGSGGGSTTFSTTKAGGYVVQQDGTVWYTDLEQCRQQEKKEKNFPENWKKDC